MNDRNRWRSGEAHRIVSEYRATGNTFDGIYQNLLPRLRENRRADPEIKQTEGFLTTVQRVTGNRFTLSAAPFPHLILDTEVLISYARLDNQTVGTALVDAVADTSCNIIVSSLAYLRAATRVYGTRAYGRLLRLMDRRPEGDDFPFIDVHELERETANLLAALDTEDRPDIAHTALIALPYRCVVATLEPSSYHRLGYLRTVDLS